MQCAQPAQTEANVCNGESDASADRCGFSDFTFYTCVSTLILDVDLLICRFVGYHDHSFADYRFLSFIFSMVAL
jgi:hypothetical protein